MAKLTAHLLLATTLILAAAGAHAADQPKTHPYTHLQTFMGFAPDTSVVLRGVQPGATPEAAALVALRQHGRAFGVNDPRLDLKLVRSHPRPSGGHTLRYEQYRKHLPVFNGALLVNLDAGRRLVSISGTLAPDVPVSTLARVTSDGARSAAVAAVGKSRHRPLSGLVAEAPELGIYDPRLFGFTGGNVALAWQVTVVSVPGPGIRQRVLVDAHSGAILLSFSRIDGAKQRKTFTSANTDTLPGTPVCDESAGDACSNGANGEADHAHLYAGNTYDFYQRVHGRDSLDDAGLILQSSVLWNDPSVCPNAFWDGARMVYCAGAPFADDVVAHELTHGVTDFTSKLEYMNQSGAINESFSDLWGEFVDQTNNSGSDGDTQRWLLGEDWVGTGVIRNMMDPSAFDQPDSTQSTLYAISSDDNGGVHTNSGVNNKAAALLVDGGTVKDKVLLPLSGTRNEALEKTARIYYEVQTALLQPSATYPDLYVALNQACLTLKGSHGITQADCSELDAILQAVQMHLAPPQPVAAVAPVCDGSLSAHDSFLETFESDLSAWHADGVAPLTWGITGANPGDGVESVAIEGTPDALSRQLTLANPVVVPTAGKLHFLHNHGFEPEADGGVVEISADNGVTWQDLGSRIEAGDTYGMITSDTNDLGIRQMFNGESIGWGSTRVDLKDFAGQSVLLRFTFASDTGTASRGWQLDNVRLYQCVESSGNLPPVASVGSSQHVISGATVTLLGLSSDPDGSVVSTVWTQVSGDPQINIEGSSNQTATFVAPQVDRDTDLVFEFMVTDNQGDSATARTTITVSPSNQPPVVEAGVDQSVTSADVVTLSGSATDTDGSVESFSWTQVSGATAVVASPSSASTSFVAPEVSANDVLEFRLVATDNNGASSEDTVTIIVRPKATSNPGSSVNFNPGSSGGGGGDPGLLVLSLMWWARRRYGARITRR